MSAKLIDGKALANRLEQRVKKRVQQLKKNGLEPCLAVILVGENPASKVYVHRKEVSCEAVGIKTEKLFFPETVSEEELLKTIQQLNQNSAVHGLLVQLPLPGHLDENKITQSVLPEKDVDGFHFLNQGKLFSNAPEFVPNTPRGIIQLIQSTKTPIAGKHAVIIGRSLAVGKPTALLLLHQNATVTVCHSKTKNLAEKTRQADILVAAVGKPKLVSKEMVKEGAIVIDVGINRVDGKLVGDVDFDSAKEKASFITPVPGGVGPMTVACLLENTVLACEKQSFLQKKMEKGKLVVVGVLGSTKGSDMQAIIEAIERKELNARIGLVVSNKKDAFILERAKRHNIPALFVDSKAFSSLEEFDMEMAERFKKAKAELVLLIGYNKILTKPFLDSFPNRILNIHPSLLPAFGGAFDQNVHEAVLKAGVKVSGATLHLVTEDIDRGPIVMQKAVEIEKGETADSLKQKVQKAEQELLIQAIESFAGNKDFL